MFSPARLRVIIAASLAVGVLVSYERGHRLGGGHHVGVHSCVWQRQDSHLGAWTSGCQGRGLAAGWLCGVLTLLRTRRRGSLRALAPRAPPWGVSKLPMRGSLQTSPWAGGCSLRCLCG